MRLCSSLLALVLSLAGLVLTAHGDEKRPTDRPASFPCKFGLEGKYEAFRQKLPAAEAVQALLQEDAEGQNLVPWGEGRYTSVWVAVDHRVALEKEMTAALAQLPDGEARALLEPARQAGDLGRIIAVYRRSPWSAAVLEALVETGEQELRRGHAGLALRCFQDALTRTNDLGLRGRAQVGLWLALASGADGALETAFRDINPDAEYPWLGGRAKAATIRERLAADRKEAPSPKLTELERRVLRVPASSTWVHEQPGIHDEGAVAAGPNLLAWFAPGSDKPSWSLIHPTAVTPSLWAPVAPGPFVPAVASGRVCTRWGVEPLADKRRDGRNHPYLLTNVAAFDCTSGAMLWSTGRDPSWEDLAPVSDPTLAEGRLYVLAVSRKDEYSAVLLVCLDAATGAVQWRRELVSARTTLAPPLVRGRKPPAYREIDVTHYGNAVTVACGAVYCQTNTGVVARCDARDGVVEWVTTYPRDPGTTPFLTLARRQGSVPLVIGSRVVFLPRDALSVFALDCDSGEPVWKKEGDGSFTALGVAGGQLLLADNRAITALDAATGRPGWERRFEPSIEGKTSLVGGTLYVGTSSKLYRLGAATGEVLEEQVWDAPEGLIGLAVRDRSLLIAIQTKESAGTGERK